MKGKVSVELILAGVLMVLIVAFVVWYGWLMVQIRTVGEGEQAVAEMGTPTAESAGAATSTPSSPTPPAPGVGGTGTGGGVGLGGKSAGLAPEDM
jgi:hypothetical protein